MWLPWWFWTAVKNPPANAGDTGPIPGSRIPTGEGNCNPLQYSCLRNHMNRDAWLATVHGVAKSQTWLSDYTTTTALHLCCSLRGGSLYPFPGRWSLLFCNEEHFREVGLALPWSLAAVVHFPHTCAKLHLICPASIFYGSIWWKPVEKRVWVSVNFPCVYQLSYLKHGVTHGVLSIC